MGLPTGMMSSVMKTNSNASGTSPDRSRHLSASSVLEIPRSSAARSSTVTSPTWLPTSRSESVLKPTTVRICLHHAAGPGVGRPEMGVELARRVFQARRGGRRLRQRRPLRHGEAGDHRVGIAVGE